MAVKITYFVHGTTTDNLEHKSTGWLPGVLSDKGIEQSLALKDQVDINKFDVVFCSDLQRAIDSAKYTFEGVKEIIQDERLRECNYGDYNGEIFLIFYLLIMMASMLQLLHIKHHNLHSKLLR